MSKDHVEKVEIRNKTITQHSGAGGVWFMGFIGTLVYYLHYHSGTFELVLIAIFKAVFWMAYLTYYLFQHLKV
jgi:uncharacterized protein YjlB